MAGEADWQAVYAPQSRLFESQVGLRPQLQGAAYPAPQMAELALNMEKLPLLLEFGEEL